jgi:hypothetical protein
MSIDAVPAVHPVPGEPGWNNGPASIDPATEVMKSRRFSPREACRDSGESVLRTTDD